MSPSTRTVAPPDRPTRPTPAAERSRRLRAGWPSTVLAKWIMAVTGVIFALFVLVHMIGNLKVYTGPEYFDAYALWLRTLLEPLLPYEGFLWIFRTVLLICLVLHVWCAVVISRRARIARGPHRRRGLRGMDSFAARTMPVTGIVLLLFIVFHLLDLTAGVGVAPEGFQHTTPEASHAYANLVASFSRPWAAAVYIVAMVMLFLHLAHGLWSALCDVGITVAERVRGTVMLLCGAYGLAVMIGNISIPLAVLTGVVR